MFYQLRSRPAPIFDQEPSNFLAAAQALDLGCWELFTLSSALSIFDRPSHRVLAKEHAPYASGLECLKQITCRMFHAHAASRAGVHHSCLSSPVFPACLGLCADSSDWGYSRPRQTNRHERSARDGFVRRGPFSELSSGFEPCRLELSPCRSHPASYAAGHLRPERTARARTR